MTTQIQQWLHEGITAAKAGQFAQARALLLDVVEHDQTNEVAWFWLYQVFDCHDDKRVCLENLLTINPNNQWAKQELNQYLPPVTATPIPVVTSHAVTSAKNQSPRPSKKKKISAQATLNLESIIYLPDTTCQLVTAFWVGISAIFLIGGIMGCSEWLVSVLRDKSFPYSLSIVQVIELLVASIFLSIGLLSLMVAVGLFIRSKIAFYGSLLLALSLLLIGPTISLIIAPPNYPSTICLGGVFAMIVLLTLTSIPENK